MSTSKLRSRSSSSLFSEPFVLDVQKSRDTILVVSDFDADSNIVVKHVSVEKIMSESIPLDFDEVRLDNLVSKGVNPHALDMIDSQRMGSDAGIELLGEHIINNAENYFEHNKPE